MYKQTSQSFVTLQRWAVNSHSLAHVLTPRSSSAALVKNKLIDSSEPNALEAHVLNLHACYAALD